ncbi:hypothetical protein GCM10009733_050430 [Nonomuraea maheshkhaliensis]|uniref:Uncharacterized protein n=2 Tax=Nonomuraea maheshkhaliensis TaxID=419590 RepID=A0ABP4RH25_9ACTN
MGQHAGRRVGELSDEPVEGVLRLRKDVSGQAGVVRCLHRALLSPGTATSGSPIATALCPARIARSASTTISTASRYARGSIAAVMPGRHVECDRPAISPKRLAGLLLTEPSKLTGHHAERLDAAITATATR